MSFNGHPVAVAHSFVETPTVLNFIIYFLHYWMQFSLHYLIKKGFFGFCLRPSITITVNELIIGAVIMYTVTWIWDRATYCPGQALCQRYDCVNSFEITCSAALTDPHGRVSQHYKACLNVLTPVSGYGGRYTETLQLYNYMF